MLQRILLICLLLFSISVTQAEYNNDKFSCATPYDVGDSNFVRNCTYLDYYDGGRLNVEQVDLSLVYNEYLNIRHKLKNNGDDSFSRPYYLSYLPKRNLTIEPTNIPAGYIHLKVMVNWKDRNEVEMVEENECGDRTIDIKRMHVIYLSEIVYYC